MSEKVISPLDTVATVRALREKEHRERALRASRIRSEKAAAKRLLKRRGQ